jgi:uncharacterized protein YcfJ
LPQFRLTGERIAGFGRSAFRSQPEEKTMRKFIIAATALTLIGSVSVSEAQAGCVTGAIVGGIAGHFAHHGLAGAAAGCAAGHYASKYRRNHRVYRRAY